MAENTTGLSSALVLVKGERQQLSGALSEHASRLDVVEAGQSTGALGYASLTDLQAVESPAERDRAVVTQDPVRANNGNYTYLGGAWTKDTGPSPDSRLLLKQDLLGTVRYIGEGGVYAVLADRELRVLLGYDAEADSVIGRGLVTEAGVTAMTITRGQWAEYQMASYAGGGALVPVLTDLGGRVLLGYDQTEQSVVGKGLVSLVKLEELSLTKRLATQRGMAVYAGTGPIIPFVTDQLGRILSGFDTSTNLPVPSAGAGTVTPLRQIRESEIPTRRALTHLVVYGQSLSMGSSGLPLVSTSQPYHHITFALGPRTPPDSMTTTPADLFETGPIGGETTRGETICSGMCNLITELEVRENGATLDTAQRFLASACGQGGYSIQQLNAGTEWWETHLLPTLEAGKAMADALGLEYTAHMCWLQGEEDSTLNMDADVYASHLDQLQRDFQSAVRALGPDQANDNCYLFSYQTARNKPNDGPCIGQSTIDRINPRIVQVGPHFNIITVDGVHLDGPGYFRLSRQFGRAVKTVLIDGLYYRPLRMLSAVLSGSDVTCTFEVPVPPIRLSTLIFPQTTNFGLVVRDDNGEVPISRILVAGNNKLTFHLDRDLEGDAMCRYALDSTASGTGSASIATGNIIDSAPQSVLIDGSPVALSHFAVSSELPILALRD